MLVAEQRSVEWEVTGLSNLDETGSGTLQVRVLNAGNTALSHQLILETSSGIDAAIVGDDIVNAVAGDSQQFTIKLTGKTTGSQQLTFMLSGVQDVESSSTTVNVEISASFEESASGSGTVVYIGAGIALLVGVLAVLYVLRLRNPRMSQTTTTSPPRSLAQQAAPTCWSCRTPIIGPMQGCPGCGARYHADSPTCKMVEKCSNCGTSSEQFVSA